MSRLQKLVFLAAVALFGAWLIGNFARLTADQDGLIRFVLGLLFALLILFRSVLSTSAARPASSARWTGPLVTAGALLALAGILFNVHQFEWLGLMVMLGACLFWALPPRFAPNLLPALFLLYWVHPLPGQVFGRLQLLMQALSVKGAEWALHCLNVRVWADGLVLQTGFKVFGVPESCSGMRTGVTVMLCTLGVAYLFRFRWYETGFFLALGFLQVLALNIARITAMVVWAPRMPEAWAEKFLHDTLGIFLLVSIALAQAEASWWKLVGDRWRAKREAIRQGVQEKGDRATMLPRFWRRLLTWGLFVTAGVLLVLAAVLVLYKRRPEHRAAMITGVIDNLMKGAGAISAAQEAAKQKSAKQKSAEQKWDEQKSAEQMERDLEAAERAIQAALRLKPKNRDLLSKRATTLYLRKKYKESLVQFDALPGGLDIEEIRTKSWALMKLDRAKEAVALVDSLPEGSRNLPGVAIVRAYFAAQQGDAQACSRYVVAASRSADTVEDVRALFPFLAMREQWKVIADCKSDAPFRELPLAMLAVRANLKMNNLIEASNLLQFMLREWPRNPSYLDYLFFIAMRRPGGQWEDIFAENLKANIGSLDPDTLATYLNYCFQLNRPDLGWVAYARLKMKDPLDPTLELAPAKFGPEWLLFRRRLMKVGAGAPDERVDMRIFCAVTRGIEPFQSFWKSVPLVDELVGGSSDKTRMEHFRKCLLELDQRERRGKLSLRLEMMYPAVLAAVGRYDDAHARLDAVAGSYTNLQNAILLQHAALYEQQAEWPRSYEALVAHSERTRTSTPGLTASLLMINAMMNLNLGVCAMDLARRARQDYPDTPELVTATAAIWDVFGYKEEALFELTRDGGEASAPALPQLLYDTGRYTEAERLSRTLGMQLLRVRKDQKEYHFAPPAELSIETRFPLPLTESEMDQEAARASAAAAKGTNSPFLSRLATLEARWLESRGSRETSDPKRWRDAGRNPTEKAAALHRLTLLLGRQKRQDEALKAAGMAVEAMPTSAILRRLQIYLSGGARPVVAASRQACPDDGEIWLADLVSRVREPGSRAWVTNDIRAATAAPRFSVETMVRAGHYLLRTNTNMVDVAMLAARNALPRARGYIPAYVLAIKCGARGGDLPWALAAALAAADQAIDPVPFFKTMVEIKSADKTRDAELVKALEFLKERDKGDTQWAERLGWLYFENRDLKRALTVLMPVITEDLQTVKLPSLLMAAEAARWEGNSVRAIDILEAAHAMYPKKMAVLNNLVYNLAQQPKTLERARTLLPGLLAMGKESFVVYDTASMVYLQSGQMDLAKQYMEKAQKLIDKDDYAAPEVGLNAARVLLRAGDYEAARRKVDEVRRNPLTSPALDVEARMTMDQIRAALNK